MNTIILTKGKHFNFSLRLKPSDLISSSTQITLFLSLLLNNFLQLIVKDSDILHEDGLKGPL